MTRKKSTMEKSSKAQPKKSSAVKMTVDFEQIRTWLKDLRAYRSLTLRELSERTGYYPEEIADVETGKEKPDLKMLFNLLNAMDCDLVLRNRSKKKAKQLDLTWDEIGKIGLDSKRKPNGYSK